MRGEGLVWHGWRIGAAAEGWHAPQGPRTNSPAHRLPPVQGTHTAMKSGMLAAEAAFNAMTSQPAGRPLDLSAYETAFKSSWVSEIFCKMRKDAAWEAVRFGRAK